MFVCRFFVVVVWLLLMEALNVHFSLHFAVVLFFGCFVCVCVVITFLCLFIVLLSWSVDCCRWKGSHSVFHNLVSLSLSPLILTMT